MKLTLSTIYKDNIMEQTKRIKEIAMQLEAAEEQMLPAFVDEYIKDGRPGVAKLVSQAAKRLEKLRLERARLEEMRYFEHKYEEQYPMICGIDEVGRGPLAGPVCAAAVILPRDCEILYINDSKKLSEAKREALYEEIMEKAIAVGIGLVEHTVIDEVNILQATYIAMRDAISQLKVAPDILLNDAVTIPEVDIKQVGIIKGHSKSVSIAAASNIAKETRDRLMEEYDKIFPGYGFASNKGYGTKEHIAAIKEIGPTPIHRKSFIGGFI